MGPPLTLAPDSPQWRVRELVRRIRSEPEVLLAADPHAPPTPRRSTVLPRLTWDGAAFRERFSVTLPEDLQALWDRAAGLVLLHDVVYGHGGLVVWGPDQALVRHERLLPTLGNGRRPGDLLVGEFLGDGGLVLVRADPAEPDFGRVLLPVALAPRDQWPIAGSSLVPFVHAFLDARGERVWFWSQYLG